MLYSVEHSWTDDIPIHYIHCLFILFLRSNYKSRKYWGCIWWTISSIAFFYEHNQCKIMAINEKRFYSLSSFFTWWNRILHAISVFLLLYLTSMKLFQLGCNIWWLLHLMLLVHWSVLADETNVCVSLESMWTGFPSPEMLLTVIGMERCTV